MPSHIAIFATLLWMSFEVFTGFSDEDVITGDTPRSWRP